MADIIFFEKPNCEENVQQRVMLEAAGHRVVPINILDYPWEEDELLRYFNARPTFNWFNYTASNILNGLVNVYNLTPSQAIKNMLKDHSLIKYPLLKIEDKYLAGFDVEALEDILKVRFMNPLTNKLNNQISQVGTRPHSNVG